MASQYEQQVRATQSRMDPSFIQVGVVKDNRDPHKMGRLKVWVQGSASAEDNKNGWITCSYASPFAGRTQGSPNAESYDEFPQSYGFWAVPPDVGTRVFLFFANGRIEQAYWFGGAFDHLMNTNTPGAHTKLVGNSTVNAPYPVVDFDRNTSNTDPNNNYVNVPLADGLQRQNLLYDTVKGTPDRSARRQAPAMVYGMSTPRGNHIVLDDGYTDEEINSPTTWDDDQDGFQNTEYGNPTHDTTLGGRKQEGICLRTRSGAQILISESEGNVFIINRDGSARIEMDKDGNVSILGDRDISVRSKRDVNYYAERDMNIETIRNLNFKVGGIMKTEVTGDTHGLYHGDVVQDCDKSFRLYTKDSIRCKADTTLSLSSTGDLVLQSDANVGVKGTSAVKLDGGDGKLTVAGNVSVSNNLQVGADVKTAKVSLNNHVHGGIQGGPGKTAPAEMGGGGNSASSPPEAQPADDIVVAAFELSAFQDVIDVNPDSVIGEQIAKDIAQRPDKSLSALCFLMPADGKITHQGYWGRNIVQAGGNIKDNSGWVIETHDLVCNVAKGYVREKSGSHVIVDHKNGFMSIYRGIEVFPEVMTGLQVEPSFVIGKSPSKFLFEIRRSGAAAFGFEGTVDPGLFYHEVTGIAANANNKTLTMATASNPVNVNTEISTTDTTDVVKLVEIKSIISTLPQSGYIRKPTNKARSKSQRQTTSATTVSSPNDSPVVKDLDPTPIDWVVEATDNNLIEKLKQDEGSIELQTAYNYFNNGRFIIYRDTLGFETIGYGHLVRQGEDYTQGLTVAGADALLRKDFDIAVRSAKSVAESYEMHIPRAAQEVLAQMTFQLGRPKTMQFRKFLTALSQNDYQKAAIELRDSAWYTQTPHRVDQHIAVLNSL